VNLEFPRVRVGVEEVSDESSLSVDIDNNSGGGIKDKIVIDRIQSEDDSVIQRVWCTAADVRRDNAVNAVARGERRTIGSHISVRESAVEVLAVDARRVGRYDKDRGHVEIAGNVLRSGNDVAAGVSRGPYAFDDKVTARTPREDILVEVESDAGAVVRRRYVGGARYETAEHALVGRYAGDERRSFVDDLNDLSRVGRQAAGINGGPYASEVVHIGTRAVGAGLFERDRYGVAAIIICSDVRWYRRDEFARDFDGAGDMVNQRRNGGDRGD